MRIFHELKQQKAALTVIIYDTATFEVRTILGNGALPTFLLRGASLTLLPAPEEYCCVAWYHETRNNSIVEPMLEPMFVRGSVHLLLASTSEVQEFTE